MSGLMEEAAVSLGFLSLIIFHVGGNDLMSRKSLDPIFDGNLQGFGEVARHESILVQNHWQKGMNRSSIYHDKCPV